MATDYDISAAVYHRLQSIVTTVGFDDFKEDQVMRRWFYVHSQHVKSNYNDIDQMEYTLIILSDREIIKMLTDQGEYAGKFGRII